MLSFVLTQRWRLMFPVALVCLTALAAGPAPAAVFTPITQSGTITTDDQDVLFNFTVPTTQTLYFYTASYAGGRNANGTVAAEGGYDPLLSLYDSAGTSITSNDDADPNFYVRPDAVTHDTFDSFFSQALTPGQYTLALTESGNYPVGNLSDGFSEDGNGNFTAAANGPPNATGAFYDSSGFPGVQRNGNYTFNISATAPVVPEASSALSLGVMLALGLGGIFLITRGRSAAK